MKSVSEKQMAPFFTAIKLFLLLSGFLLVASRSAVKFLPGFEGPLPFELETGYVGVDEGEDVQLFYYFVKSESNPREDPLLLWFTGGPGCSAFSGLAYEIGPLKFDYDVVQNDESLPKLVLNPFSWSKVASIIFIDFPVGTGFSYGRTSRSSQSTDLQACDQAHQFLRKWLTDHPEFLSNPFYMAGDSYSGIIVPIITQLISNGNEAGIEPHVNLKGYVLGNPLTHPEVEKNYRIPFAHGMGLISDELYESLQKTCRGNYFDVDPSNKECLQDVDAYNQCVEGLSTGYILEPNCGFDSARPLGLFGKRFAYERNIKLIDPQPSIFCAKSQVGLYRLSHTWLNNDDVREALHIRKGSIGEWVRCNFENMQYTKTTMNSFPYHVNLSTKGYRSLVYSGDHDMLVPFLATQAWIRSLNYSIVDDWRSWLLESQVVGYTRTYSNRMTFATVKGGGHVALERRPYECFAMFKRWISNQPL